MGLSLFTFHLHLSLPPPVAEAVGHEVVAHVLVDPSASFPSREGLAGDCAFANEVLAPAVAVGIERLVGGVAEGLAMGEQPEFVAVIDEELLQLVEGYFDNFVCYFCHSDKNLKMFIKIWSYFAFAPDLPLCCL